MLYLQAWFHLDWFLFALAGAGAGFLIGGSIRIVIERDVGGPPGRLRTWPVVFILLCIGSLFVILMQDAVFIGCMLSGFGIGYIVREWWSHGQDRSQ